MTDPTTLLALAERSEQAAGPDRELDAEIAVGLFGGEIIWKAARYTMDLYPARRFQNSDYIGGYQNSGVLTYTESLDAAATLVPTEPPHNLRIGKWWWMLETWSDYCRASVNYENGDSAILEESAEAATPALALCAAALRARAAAHD